MVYVVSLRCLCCDTCEQCAGFYFHHWIAFGIRLYQCAERWCGKIMPLFFINQYIAAATHTQAHTHIQYLSLTVYFPIMVLSSFLAFSLDGFGFAKIVQNAHCSLARSARNGVNNSSTVCVCLWCVQNLGTRRICVSNGRFTWSIQPFLVRESIQRCVLLNAHLMEDSCLHILLHRSVCVKKMCLITNCVLDKKFYVHWARKQTRIIDVYSTHSIRRFRRCLCCYGARGNFSHVKNSIQRIKTL